jgi:hypothetical protein
MLKCWSAAADTKCFSHASGRQALGFNPGLKKPVIPQALTHNPKMEMNTLCEQEDLKP